MAVGCHQPSCDSSVQIFSRVMHPAISHKKKLINNHTASIVNMPVNMQTTHRLWVQRYLRLMALNLRLPILDVQEASMSQSHHGTVLSDRVLGRTAVTLTCTLHTPCTLTATWNKRQTCGGNTTVWDSGDMWSQRAESSNCIQYLLHQKKTGEHVSSVQTDENLTCSLTFTLMYRTC